MKIRQYVMAYRADENKIKELLPAGFESLRPALRINVECYDGDEDWGYVEFNTPVAAQGKRGWLNLAAWLAKPDYMHLEFTPVGKRGGCPHEADNDGCFYWDYTQGGYGFLETEVIDADKEYCDCSLSWELPPANEFVDDDERIRSFIKLPVEEILGAYVVDFERETEEFE
ncbi:MAG: hypothetical protein HUJ79_05805 [Firmicutes bacterium]|nr:hypothetical protein [Bacillota bacterium]